MNILNVIIGKMQHIKRANSYKNLYIDESGYNYIGQSKYRFFLLSATVIDSIENELANKLFLKWRSKHLINPYRCFHASQFFEDRESIEMYKRHELSMTRNFNNSLNELMELINYINFSSVVYYIDLPKLRKRLELNEPPVRLKELSEKEYTKAKKDYSSLIKLTLGEKKRYLPLAMALKRCFDFHNEILGEKSDGLLNGYINIESQSSSDIQLIKIFHRYISKNQTYGKNIIGLNLHTKSSLDAGIELADFITYIACQTLRFKYRLHTELKDIPSNRIKSIKNIRALFRSKNNIEIVDVTKDEY